MVGLGELTVALAIPVVIFALAILVFFYLDVERQTEFVYNRAYNKWVDEINQEYYFVPKNETWRLRNELCYNQNPTNFSFRDLND